MTQPFFLFHRVKTTLASSYRSNRTTTRRLALVAALAFVVSCASGGPARMEKPSMDYLQAVHQLESQGVLLEVGSEAERQAIERFQLALSDFKVSDLRQRIRAAYAQDVYFNDTLKTIQGLDSVEEYLLGTAHEVDETKVDFLDVVSSEGNYYFRWQMTIRAPKLDNGKPIHSVGMTHVRFNADGKVALHKDYWDSTSGFFEHVPVLGWMLRRVKKKL